MKATRSAKEQFRPGAPTGNRLLTMLGACAGGVQARRFALLAAQCRKFDALTEKFKATADPAWLRKRERRWERSIAPRLTALMFPAVRDCDGDALRAFANVLDALKVQGPGNQALPMHERIARLADVLRARKRLPADAMLPVTAEDFMEKLGLTPRQIADHDGEASQYRRAFRELDLRFTPANKGRKLGARFGRR